jgi:hypothetical protein
MGWILPRSGHVFQSAGASSGVRTAWKTCRHPYPNFGPRAKTQSVVHPMNELVHRMNQNGVDPTKQLAHFPIGGRVVRRAHRLENVPTSLSEVWAPIIKIEPVRSDMDPVAAALCLIDEIRTMHTDTPCRQLLLPRGRDTTTLGPGPLRDRPRASVAIVRCRRCILSPSRGATTHPCASTSRHISTHPRSGRRRTPPVSSTGHQT